MTVVYELARLLRRTWLIPCSVVAGERSGARTRDRADCSPASLAWSISGLDREWKVCAHSSAGGLPKGLSRGALGAGGAQPSPLLTPLRPAAGQPDPNPAAETPAHSRCRLATIKPEVRIILEKVKESILSYLVMAHKNADF